MFENLSDRLSTVFKNLRSKTISEEVLNASLREVRMALLEADVNLGVVRDFIEKIRVQCQGLERVKGLTPDQQVVKIVNDELITLLGGTNSELNLKANPNIVMMVGLQGSGKTTSAAKIANLLRKQKMRPYLAPLDIYRPAAIEQLCLLAKQLDIPYYPANTEMKPVEIAKASLADAKEKECNLLLLDTAGRLHIDEPLMQELVEIRDTVKPQEILFVADALTGQNAVEVAKTFHERLGITGVVLSKMDGDARGGAALSIKSATGIPVKFVGVGEKLSEIELFHPERIAGRILGMGDILTLVEKAQEHIEADEALALAKKMQKASFTLEDFRTQMRQIKKLGSFDTLLSFLPGMSGIREKLSQNSLPEDEMRRVEAIINSMTMQERCNPEILNGSRRARIAKGSGVTVAQVNQMIRQFEQTRKMMKDMLSGRKPSLPNLPAGMKMPKFMPKLSNMMPPGMNIPGMNLPGMNIPGMPNIPNLGNELASLPSMDNSTKKRKKRERPAKRKKK